MVTKLSWPGIVDLLTSAKYRIVLIMPAIHEEWVTAIEQNDDTQAQVDIKICIDNSEKVIRNGYGSANSIERLRHNYIDIQECAGLRINFLCVDDSAWYLFIESRILAGDPDGYNAIEVDSLSAENIMKQFFIEPDQATSENIEILTAPLNNKKAEEIKEAIKHNPPAEPDLQRQISTYKTHFQYAEIHFEGGNIQSKTISIPADALPFKDSELQNRMKTRFNLFTKDDTDKWEKLDDLKKEIDRIRTKYLHPCKLKRDRSVLKKENKDAFLIEVENLKKIVIDKTKALIDEIQLALNKSEDALKAELNIFFASNPPKTLFAVNDAALRKRAMDKMINEIIYKMKIPNANDLIKKMKLDVQYAEFSEEDLDNKDFLKWFMDKELITSATKNELATFKKAYQVKI